MFARATKDDKNNKTGFISNVFFNKSRIGNLLVRQGTISASQLKSALETQKFTKKTLGQILLQEQLATKSQIRFALLRQSSTRFAATLLMTAMSFGSFGSKKTWAGSIQDVPAKIAVAFNTGAQNPYGDLQAHPKVFGATEKRSKNIKPFTKWSDMFAKFDRQLSQGQSNALVQDWRKALKRYEGMDLKTMSVKVNDFVNSKKYVSDNRNYGTSDYWATPVEFLQRGGDCEDFAIAKYTALRALGVPESRLRVAIVQDTLKNIPHAVLIVYTDEGSYVLDNQIKTLIDADYAGRYRPIYSINRTAWWLHTAPKKGTRVASAAPTNNTHIASAATFSGDETYSTYAERRAARNR